MKYTLWLFLDALFLPYVTFADVKVSEVAWMGTAKSQYSEWIELYNSGEEAVSLAGWKLYKAGNQLIYTLSKTIAPQSYLLIERTTASAPDAVDGINDEAGAFGASGFKNTGEDISLKDEKGTVVDTLSFSGGWPAGDATSGKTMQWNGSTWITAESTPGAVNATVSDVVPDSSSSEDDEESDNPTVSSASTSKSNTTQKAPPAPKKPSLVAIIPKSIFQGVQNEYIATFENADVIRSPQGYFYWNMGDGTTYVQTSLSAASHLYSYEGTYTISLSYYASPTASKPLVQTTATLSVTKPTVTLEVFEGGTAVRITNSTSKIMDVGKWLLAVTEANRSLPEFTLIAPKSSIVISARTLGVSLIDNPVLYTPDGRVVLK